MSFNWFFISSFILCSFYTNIGSVSMPEKHLVSFLLFNHVHIQTMYITTYNTTQYIHLNLVYNKTQCILLHLVYNIIHIRTQSITQCIHMSWYNDYIIHITQYNMCTTQHVWHLHNTTCTQHHLHNVYTTPYVHIITCIMCTQYNMYISPPSQHVHNTTYTTCTQHMCTTLHAWHLHNTTCTQNYMYYMYTTPHV